MQVRGLECVVTGASEGIGRAVALELASRGCHIVLVARHRDGLERVRLAVEQGGGRATAAPLDVRDGAAVAALFSSLAVPPRLVVVNAGIGVHGPAEEMTASRAREVLEVNTLGAFHTVAAALPLLRQASPAALVALSSLSGLIPYTGGTVYGGSKAAVIHYLRCLRLEVAGSGVAVGWLCPGPVDTRMIVDGVPTAKLPRLARMLVPVLSPERVAREVVRLAEGGGGGRVVPWTAAFFAGVARHMPRLAERVLLLTGAGEA